MFSKTLLALAAVALVSSSALVATSASAAPQNVQLKGTSNNSVFAA